MIDFLAVKMLCGGAGEGVDPAVMQEVAKMVAQSCSTCSKAMRAEGVKVPCSSLPFGNTCSMSSLACILCLHFAPSSHGSNYESAGCMLWWHQTCRLLLFQAQAAIAQDLPVFMRGSLRPAVHKFRLAYIGSGWVF